MYLLQLDSEQADLIKAANDMMHAAMDARARRMDPEEIVSKTAKMSRAKCESVMAQLALGPLLEWDQMSFQRQRDIIMLAHALTEAKNEKELFTIYSGLRNVILLRDQHPDLPWHTPTDEETDLRGSALEADSGAHEKVRRKMRKKVRPEG